MSANANDNSWEIAKNVAKKIGYIPIAFSQAIRMLVTDHIKNKGELRAVTKYQISRLFRGDSFKSTIYFASKELRAEFLEKNKACTVGDLVALYNPLDLAAFITCFYLNRQMKKVGKGAWPLVANHFSREASVGALVGVAIPKIGHGPGLILAGLRNVAHCLLSLDKPELYKDFRTKLDASNKVADEALEMQIWGTTGSQVTSMILAHLGFMTELGDAMGTAVRTKTPVGNITDDRLREFRLAHIWQETFLLGSKQPLEKLSTQFFPLDADRKKSAEFIERAREGTSSWLDRGKADLTKEKAPHLFTKKQINPDFEIPEELTDVFSIEELTSMEEEDFDRLIDQIDAEQKAGAKREDVISSKDLEELEKTIG